MFDGPIDNPGLDIVALRRNLQVEAGVSISGTAHAPAVQLVSEPPVPDNEKLSWMVLGKGLDTTSGADFALLQAATSVLGGGNAPPLTQRIARGAGLDTLDLRTAGLRGQVLALGKRLSERVYIEYEHGIAIASSVVRLNLVLSRFVTARLEAGAASGIGVVYGRSFD